MGEEDVIVPDLMALPDRIAEKIHVTDDGCWRWTACTDRSGYGGVGWAGRRWIAHRLVYTLLFGPIPDGMDLDHLCHNRDSTCPGGPSCRHRACVNPEHCEPATRRRNLRRGRSANRDRTHCKHGHRFTRETTYVFTNSSGGQSRQCLVCKRERRMAAV